MSSYQLSRDIVFERFNEGALILFLVNCQVIALNAVASEIITMIRDHYPREEIHKKIELKYNILHEQTENDINDFYLEMQNLGVIELYHDWQNEEKSIMDAVTKKQCYIKSSEIVTREEDPEEGALLFNPDNGEMKIINPTGLMIWQFCQLGHTQDEIVNEIRNNFGEVPMDQVYQDVQDFLDGMAANGFMNKLDASN